MWYKGENVSFPPSMSLGVKLFKPFKGVYKTGGDTGEAGQPTPAFYYRALNFKFIIL